MRQVLGEAEQSAVRQAVLDHRPRDLGLSGQFWTRRLMGAADRLKRWGLTFQRPGKWAAEQDPDAVRRWHEEAWPEIRAKAK
ncbi:winged helix-turn-helix domain-containing protein [Streptomyces erythrochromogenes]|uniref:winged helix-turn-helix domain-containing protein n=1 Tax=Streptomyces erythrochromogenes TaxID=285574 RepID=UPI0022587CCA|nr:winged helix-turn-helix domain-containing protein [Streptomyces erythrochromogenes]MCX5586268.1 winged helix-turn-helix domain-containing protein [Streptomyces erythrochromogenes]